MPHVYFYEEGSEDSLVSINTDGSFSVGDSLEITIRNNAPAMWDVKDVTVSGTIVSVEHQINVVYIVKNFSDGHNIFVTFKPKET